MADRIIQTDTLSDIADAIRLKTGKSGTITPLQMPDEISSISGGGGGSLTRSKWYRPPDFPDYDSLTDKSIFSRNESGGAYQVNAFLTLSTQIPNANIFCIKTSHFSSCTLGTLSNGVFVPLQTISASSGYFTIDLDAYSSSYNYVVVHLVADTSDSLALQNVIAWSGASNETGRSPVVEIYGLWDGFTITEVSYSPIAFYTARYATIYGSNAGTNNVSGYSYAPTWVEVIDFSKVETVMFNRPMTSMAALKQFILPSGKTTVGRSASTLFKNCHSLESLNLNGADFSSVTSLEQFFSYCLSLKTLDLTNVDWSSVTKMTNTFSWCQSLENFILDGATMPSVSFSLANSSALTNASLVSIANALPTASATLTLHATPKANLSTIVGTVTDGTFTADENGTVTLMDFITNTKGWTVA